MQLCIYTYPLSTRTCWRTSWFLNFLSCSFLHTFQGEGTPALWVGFSGASYVLRITATRPTRDNRGITSWIALGRIIVMHSIRSTESDLCYILVPFLLSHALRLFEGWENSRGTHKSKVILYRKLSCTKYAFDCLRIHLKVHLKRATKWLEKTI